MDGSSVAQLVYGKGMPAGGLYCPGTTPGGPCPVSWAIAESSCKEVIAAHPCTACHTAAVLREATNFIMLHTD